MSAGTALIILIVAWIAWKVFKRIRRGRRQSALTAPGTLRTAPIPTKRSYVLKAGPALELVEMPEATSRLFTYEDERRAAQARQRLWMRYEDRQGHVTERTVEIYQPEDDEVIFAWCCLARAPRTFARRSIQSWRLLPDRFVFDPVINQYWEEEGARDMSEKTPWRRWLEDQPDDIADRYR